MANTTTKITDDELRTKLKESHLEKAHKDELRALIPDMPEADRNQLLKLIAQSHKVKEQEDKAKAEMQPALKKLNAKYDKKMDQLGKELNKKVRKDYEGFKKGEEEKELEEMEAEFKEM